MKKVLLFMANDFFYNEADKNLVYKYYNLLKDFKKYTNKFIGEIS